MGLIKYHTVLLVLLLLTISGCGGGGGGGDTDSGSVPPTTKTATLKFFSQSTNPGDKLSGFDLSVTLPAGAFIPTDISGVPLSSVVYLSGNSSGLLDASYDSSMRKLTANSGNLSSYDLGEFITILVTVSDSYVPRVSDITYSFTAWGLPAGTPMPTVTATATFN